MTLHGAGGTRSIEFPEPREVDLLDYQNGATVDLLDGVEVDAGDYEWMRLEVIAEENRNDGSYILFESGEQYPLYIPSGAQTGLKLNRPFTVAAGGITRLVADFDLRKSIIQPPGLSPNYVLKPVLRLMDELEVGAIAGEVDLAALAVEQLEPGAGAADCAGGVYLFAGTDALPDDADGDSTDGNDPSSTSPSSSTGSMPWFRTRSHSWKQAITRWPRPATSMSTLRRRRANTTPGAASGEAGFETMTWTANGQVVVEPDATTIVNLP